MKQNITEIGLKKTIEIILPYMVTAGEMAKGIQKSIAKQEASMPEQKDGDPFHSALTDADILVESFLGIQIYAMFDNVKFEGEEKDQDRISNYFPEKTEYTITLDPINGTLFFKNGLPIFDIIITIIHKGKVVAAIDYMPHQEKFYIGIKQDDFYTTGAYVVTRDQVGNSDGWKKIKLNTKSNTILTQRVPADIRANLEKHFKVVELTDYQGGPDWCYSACHMLTGKISGLYKPNSNLLDWGAVGFIASLAGGCQNEVEYDPVTFRTPQMVVGASKEIYQQMADVILKN